MAECFFYLLCGTLLSLISSISSAPTCSPSDLIALRSFAASFPAGNFSDWADSDDCCTWGLSVTCDMNNKSSTVTELSLQSNERGMLNYPIPLSLCNLTSLTSLILIGGSSTSTDGSSLNFGMSGSIPDCIGTRLTNLVHLDLSFNNLQGPIPHSFSHLQSLDSLVLSHNKLVGGFPEWIGSLSDLEFLDLSYNSLNGGFPEWIGSLSDLESLDLSYNSLNGSLPESWGNLPLLSFLDLSGNSLVAPDPGAPVKLPSWFCTRSSTQELEVWLSSMRIQAIDLHCSPSLRPVRNGLSFLRLHLSMNNLSSSVLQCLSNYSTYSQRQLGFLNLSGNPLALNLNLEEAIQLLPQSLEYGLDMSSCGLRGNLSGSFFDRIGTDPYFLSLAHNSLEGQVPAQLGNLSLLMTLDLSHNHFTGVAPLRQKLPLINDIQLSNNHLVGKLSSLLLNFLNISVCHLRNTIPMYNLDVSNNFLTGFIPPSLGECISDNSSGRLKLNNNQLEGFIPNELFENGTLNLRILSLSNNQLTGPIPSSFRNLKDLMLLDLSHNRLEGSLETVILFSNASSNQYSQLRVLVLGYNEFSGSVPSSLEVIAPALQLIDFSNNHLTGTIPMHSLQNLSAFRSVDTSSNPRLSAASGTLYEELRITVDGNDQSYHYVLAALTVLDLSGNNLSGPISTGLGELSGLVYLNLSRNRFSERIPSDLGQLASQLQSLDLSYNELVGPIPTSFQNLKHLGVFNVSYNPGLEGPIPQNNPQLETRESYSGDPNLCGAPILDSCRAATLDTPSAHPHISRKSNKFADWIDEWISIPGLCLGLVVGLLGTLCILARMYPR